LELADITEIVLGLRSHGAFAAQSVSEIVVLSVGWESETSLKRNFSAWVNDVFDSIDVSLVVGDLDGGKDVDFSSAWDVSEWESIDCFEPSGLVVSKGKVFDDSLVSDGDCNSGHPPSSIWNCSFEGDELEGNFPVQFVSNIQHSDLNVINVQVESSGIALIVCTISDASVSSNARSDILVGIGDVDMDGLDGAISAGVGNGERESVESVRSVIGTGSDTNL
jgi:hypothetical protein